MLKTSTSFDLSLLFLQLKQLDVCFKYVVNEVSDERNQNKSPIDIFWPMTRFFKYIDPVKAGKRVEVRLV